MNHRAEFTKLLRACSHMHPVWRVFSDFCEASALSIANRFEVDEAVEQKREQRYLDIVGRYDKEDIKRFPQMLGLVTMALEDEYQDFLGQTFMDIDLGNHFKGQFFTPYHLCRAMAGLTIGNARERIKGKELLTISEPACGGGAMIIAVAELLREQGINYQDCVFVHGMDVDATAAHMAYVQWSLLGIPALVTHGNALSMEVYGEFRTPMYWLGDGGVMPFKIHRWLRRQMEGETETTEPAPAADVTLEPVTDETCEQLSMNF